MAASLVRSRAMVTHAIDRHRWNEVTDGAVLQEDGTIIEIGTTRNSAASIPMSRWSAVATRYCCRGSSTVTIISG